MVPGETLGEKDDLADLVEVVGTLDQETPREVDAVEGVHTFQRGLVNCICHTGSNGFRDIQLVHGYLYHY